MLLFCNVLMMTEQVICSPLTQQISKYFCRWQIFLHLAKTALALHSYDESTNPALLWYSRSYSLFLIVTCK